MFIVLIMIAKSVTFCDDVGIKYWTSAELKTVIPLVKDFEVRIKYQKTVNETKKMINIDENRNLSLSSL